MRLRYRILLLLLTVATAQASSDSGTNPVDSGPWELGPLQPPLSVIPSVPAVCGAATVTGLLADKTLPVGTVEVQTDGSSLYVSCHTPDAWPMSKTALYVGASVEGIPTSGGGNPRVGRIPYKSGHLEGTTDVVWNASLAGLEGAAVVVAAFAELNGDGEGAWAEGSPISPGGNWSMAKATRVDLVGRTFAVRWNTDGPYSPTGRLALSPDEGILPVELTGPAPMRIELATGSWLEIPLTDAGAYSPAGLAVR